MSFAQSCSEFKLKDGHILKVKAKNTSGDWEKSKLDLNDYIGNQDGWFMWGGRNFSESGHGFELHGSKLVGYLKKKDGGYREMQGIELNDKITNQNGDLKYIG